MITTPGAIPILTPGAAILFRIADSVLEPPPPPPVLTVADRLLAVLKPEER
jgi:hypothetical protein